MYFKSFVNLKLIILKYLYESSFEKAKLPKRSLSLLLSPSKAASLIFSKISFLSEFNNISNVSSDNIFLS